MRRPSALLAALLLGSAAGVAVAVGPAAAAACPAGQGVTVVVGSSVSCDANGGGQAADNFRDAGHTLTMVDRQPGFVCRVDGVPASAGCVNTPPANAYWGLFWSDGTSGKWVYASQGAGSLSIPAGGWVGFAFQDGETRTPPGVTPGSAAPKPAPAPTAKAKPKPTPKATATATTKQASKPATQPTTTPGTQSTSQPTTPPTAQQSPAASPTAATPSAGAAPADEPQATSTPGSTDEVDTAAAANATDTDDSAGSGPLPLVAGVLVVALIGGMGAVLWRRKAAGGSS